MQNTSALCPKLRFQVSGIIAAIQLYLRLPFNIDVTTTYSQPTTISAVPSFTVTDAARSEISFEQPIGKL